MTRRVMIAGVLLVLLARTAPMTAHKGYRIIGTIVSVTATRLDVKQTKDGKTISMAMDPTTEVWRAKKKVAATELKAGLSVVVEACGENLKELEAFEVRIVPTLAKK